MMVRRPYLRELLIFLAFAGLTIIMTWPWARSIRDAVPDVGDPYLNAWIMWWDYHQTFRDPLNLFHSNIFFPYRYTLAFSENNYGIALLFFPLYAIGLRPLTVHGVATLFGFALSGYGAFRLARTLTGSNGVAWVAGIAFGFTPYRFHQVSHLNYMFAGWIPLLLEALVLFARERSKRRAAWLGVAFLMNALSCIHWFILTLIPLGVSAAYLLTRYRIWRDRAFWLRGTVALLLASIVLLPFLLPYKRVSEIYGFVRNPEETALYSALPIDWLTADWRSKFWKGFGPPPQIGERALFPGLLPLLLAVAAFFFVQPLEGARAPRGESLGARTPSRRVLGLLDALALIFVVIALLATGFETFRLRLFGLEILRASDATTSLFLLTVILLARFCLAYPQALAPGGERNLIETLRSPRREEAFHLGVIWVVIGFFGSLGMNFYFHRFLFEFVTLFRSSRVPARWAMICYLGLALLAGLGAERLSRLIARGRRPLIVTTALYALVCLALLYEQRAAPLDLVRGEVDPDPLTLRLKETPMKGGLVELPAGEGLVNHRYVLRAADHARPLVTAFSGFLPPIEAEIESLTRLRPIPDRFLDLLEAIPASYLAVHNAALTPEGRLALEAFLERGIAAGRLRYIKNYGGRNGDDLYAVVKTEPEAKSEAPAPFTLGAREWSSALREDPTRLLSEFERGSFPLYRFYKATFGRAPRFQEFNTDMQTLTRGLFMHAPGWTEQLETNRRQFADAWTGRKAFKAIFDGQTNEQFVDRLFANAGVTPREEERAALVSALNRGSETRADILRRVVDDAEFARKDFNPALVLMHYFSYLRRNPGDPPDRNTDGYDFWLNELERSGDRFRLTKAFMESIEYKAIQSK